MTAGYLTVKVQIPLDEYRLLNVEAQKHRKTVAQIITARITTPRHGGSRPGSGLKSGYTTEMGHRIKSGRDLNMSWPEISQKLGVSTTTARDWLTKYENEKRERAESRTP